MPLLKAYFLRGIFFRSQFGVKYATFGLVFRSVSKRST